ncbi:MAG: hypothetical protein NZ826_08010, partial [Thermodesulfovibrio sp.]|nr:hypothetical protein [Thermodesulfovibrio sp.]
MGIFSVEIFEEIEKLEPDLRKAFIKILKDIEKNLGEVVRREDFLELKKVVENIGKKIEELTEAHRRAEERISRLEESVSRLEHVVSELAEAQKRTEERVSRLETA